VSGYFQGPEGDVYGVISHYREELEQEFNPIASAIIYSFSF
jgi:hypothetical protein